MTRHDDQCVWWSCPICLPAVIILAAAIVAMFCLPIFIAFGQPIPCDAQAARMQAREPALAITLGKSDVATAKANREVIEQALRNGGTVTLPEGFIAVDRGLRLPPGCTLQGAGSKTVLRNVATGAPFGDNCTLVIHPQYRDAGIGYADGFDLIGRSTIKFRDAWAIQNYAVNSWLYTFKWNGYAEPGGSKAWVHQVRSKTADTLTLSVAPQAGANAAAYTSSAVRISGAIEGNSSVKIASTLPDDFARGRWVYITAGPTHGNECTGEFRRIVAVTNQALTLDRPLRSTHPYTLALAVLLNPTENVTVRDLAVEPFNDQSPPCYFKFAENLVLQRVVTAGDIHCGLCSNVRMYDCQLSGTINFNGCRHSSATGGRCRQVYLEELCADCSFANLIVAGSQTAGINAPPGSPSERITLRDVIVEQSRDMPIHLIGRECVVENCTVRNSGNPVPWVNVYLGGDGLRVANFRSDLNIVIRSGRDVTLSGIATRTFLGWSGPGDQPTGVCVQCPRIDTYFLSAATLAQWALNPPAVD